MTDKKPQRRTVKYNGGTLTPFPKGVSGNPNGRPPNKIKLLRQKLNLDFDLNVSEHDVKELLKFIMLASKKELDQLKDDPETPMIALGNIIGIYSDIKKGQTNTLKDLMEIAYGKNNAKDKDANTNNFFFGAANLTNESLKKIIDVTPDKVKAKKSGIEQLI